MEERTKMCFCFGTVHKPRRQVRGGGVVQMSTLLNKSYLVKVSMKREGHSCSGVRRKNKILFP